MKDRHITPQVIAALSDTPVVFVQGPRQAGKTTLVQSLRDHGYAAEYRTLDDAAALAAAHHDPDGFVESLPERVILDEIQLAPALFRSIKRKVDVRRKPGSFLLTGSANPLVLPKVSESLAGRMEILTLRPFSQGEIEGHREAFIDACFAPEFAPPPGNGEAWPVVAERIALGGYPEVVARRAPARRASWFGSYVTTILERDVRDISQVHHLRDLARVLRLIASRSSGLLNLAHLASAAQVPVSTLQRHWGLLEAVFFVQTLPAWSAGAAARLVKAPKLVVADTGLLCHLLNLDAERLRADELMTGAALETFVALELIKQAGWSRTRIEILHYRTHKQQEVDLVLEDARGRVVGIEVKKTASPRADDFRGLRHLREAAGRRFLRGILLCTAGAGVGFGSDLYALPVPALWRM
jgi:predicted AAA+ superfamily ATPase